MSTIAYIMATSSPHSLLLAGFVAGVIVCNLVGHLVDIIRASLRGQDHG